LQRNQEPLRSTQQHVKRFQILALLFPRELHPFCLRVQKVKVFVVRVFFLGSDHAAATAASLTPSDVFSCLQSVPYDPDTDTKQVAWIQDVVQFQSTLAHLKKPPPGYPYPAVDLMARLQNISAFIPSQKCTNEYDIEVRTFWSHRFVPKT